jgi:hypothetical protein
MMGSKFGHKNEMGMQANQSVMVVHRRVLPMRGHCLALHAWEDILSMPIARPEMTE